MFELAHKFPTRLLFPNKSVAVLAGLPFPRQLWMLFLNLGEKMNPKFLDNVHRERREEREERERDFSQLLSSLKLNPTGFLT